MQAMILAAGRGERMRPLTDSIPKPLIPVAGKPLIVWHIEKLALAGINDIVINHAWLGIQIEAYLGKGSTWGVNIEYSPETTALETAGGIASALPLLDHAPFLVVNADVWCDWNFKHAPAIAARLDVEKKLAWLLLVQNPEHHPAGDFGLSADEHVREIDTPRLTFAGIGLYQPELFAQTPAGQPAKLAPLLRAAMTQQKVLGMRHSGRWVDVGTPERLSDLNHQLSQV